MTEKTRRRDIMRPAQLVGLALACGLFAGAVTLMATGAFTQDVMQRVDKGTYGAIPPWNLAFIVMGGIFIVALLILSILILAVDPADFSPKTMDRPVLYDKEQPGDGAASSSSGQAESGPGSGPASATPADPDRQ